MHSADELQLDLSFLASDEDEPIIISNKSEVYYKENGAVVTEFSSKYKDITKSSHSRTDNNRETNVNCSNQSPRVEETDAGDLGDIQRPREEKQLFGSGSESEGKLSKNCNLLKNSDCNGMESQSSGTVQNFGDISSSSQGSDEERTGSTRSYTSSYVTLSEHSLDACSTSCSSKSRDMHESEISRSNSSRSSVRPNSDLASGFRQSRKIEKHRDFLIPLGDTRKIPSPNDFHQVIRRLHNGNLSHRLKSSGRNKTSTEKSSAAIRNIHADIESQVSVSSGGKDSSSVSSLVAVERGTESRTTVQSGSKGNIYVSDVVVVSADTKSQVTMHSGGEVSTHISIPESKDRRSEEQDNFVTSSALENGYEGIATAAESSLHRCREVNKVEFDEIVRYAGCRTRCIANDEENGRHVNDNSNRVPSQMYDNICRNKIHKIVTEEVRIEDKTIIDQSCVCCEGGLKICNYHTNGFILNESNNRPIHDSDFRTTSGSCSRNENYFEERPDEIMRRMELSVNKVSDETESVASDFNRPGRSASYISPIDFENYEDFDKTSGKSAFRYHQLSPANNREVQRDVDSPPAGHHAADRMRRPSAKSDCDAERKIKPSVRRTESRFFSDDSAPDVPLSASEALEAVLYAQRLLCVLERALDRALSSNTDNNNTESSMREPSTRFSARITRRKPRPRSVSPNILRRCNSIDSVRGQTQTEICSDMGHSALGISNTKGANVKQTSDVKPPLACDGVSMRSCCYRDVSPFLSLTPEQLRKQRALLKPATDRRIQGDVIQMLDVADILRNAILRRRTFTDPTDEFVCRTNTSVSEWSLENAWYKQ
jgi:hypothetical protein